MDLAWGPCWLVDGEVGAEEEAQEDAEGMYTLLWRKLDGTWLIVADPQFLSHGCGDLVVLGTAIVSWQFMERLTNRSGCLSHSVATPTRSGTG